MANRHDSAEVPNNPPGTAGRENGLPAERRVAPSNPVEHTGTLGQDEALNLLLVEDEEADARLLTGALEGATERYNITWVTGLGHALDTLARRPIHAVLLDLTLPDSSGVSSVSTLHNLFPEMPVIVLTGYEDRATAVEALHAGAQDYLVKDQSEANVVARSIRYAIERKLAELELRRSKEQLEVILQGVSDGIAVRDAEGRLIYANPAAVNTLGSPLAYNRGESSLQDLASGFPYYDEWRRPVSLEETPTVRAMRTGESSSMVLGGRLPTGEEKWSLVRGAPVFDEQRRVRQVITILTDITERKQAEDELRRSKEQLEVILSGVADGIVVATRNGRTVYVNDAAARALGFSSSEEMQTLPIEEVAGRFNIIDEWGNPVAFSDLPGRVALRGISVSEKVLGGAVTPGGEVRWSIAKAVPIFDDRGEVQMVVSIFTDITARKQMEEQVRNEAMRAETLATLSRMLAEAGPDYKSVLHTIAARTARIVGDACDISLLSDDGSHLVPAASYAVNRHSHLEENSVVASPAAADPSVRDAQQKVLRTGEALSVSSQDDATEDSDAGSDVRGFMAVSSVKAILIVPLRARGRTMGTMTVTRGGSEKPYSAFDRLFLEALSEHVALAVENARLFDAERRARQHAEILASANLTITRSLELDTVLQSLLESLRALVPYDSANVMLLEGDKVRIRAAAGYEQWTEHADKLDEISFNIHEQPHLAAIFSSQKSILISDTANEPDWATQEQGAHVRSWIGVPLVVGGKAVGLYSVDSATPGFFTPEHLAEAELLSMQAAVAVENARLYHEAQEAVREKDESLVLLDALLSTAPAGMAFIGTDYRYRQINNAMAAISGGSATEHVGCTVAEAHSELEPTLMPALQQVISTGKPVSGLEVAALPNPSEQPRHFMLSYYPVQGPGGGTLGVGAVAVDLTDRKRTEEALRESEQRFRSVFENALDVILVLDDQARLLDVNPAGCALAGVDRDTLLGCTIFDFVPAEGRADAQERWQLFLQTGQYSGDATVVLPGGRVRHIEFNGNANLREGQHLALVRDVTERKHAELELRRSRDQLQVILEGITDGITVTNSKGEVVYVNDAVVRTFGFNTAEELLATPGAELMKRVRMVDEDGNLFPLEKAPGRYALRGMESPDVVMGWQRVGTEDYQWGIVKGSPIFDEAGNVLYAITIFTDITARKRMEEELRRSRDQFEVIVKGIKDGIVVRHRSGKIVYANDTGAQMLGFTSAESLLNTDLAELVGKFELFDEWGNPFPMERMPGALALQGIETRNVMMGGFSKLTGQEHWSLVTAAPVFDDRGQVEYAISIFTDIGERRRAEKSLRASEARFKAFMENTTSVAYIKDAQGRYVYVNRSLEKLFEVSLSDVEGKTDFDLLPPDVAAELRENDYRVLSSGRPIEVLERVPTPDGSIEFWLASKFPLRDADGRLLLGGTAMNITERKQAEQALKERADQQAVVARLGRRALRGIGMSSLLQETSRLVAETLRVERCDVMELLPEQGMLLLRASSAGHVAADQVTLDAHAPSQESAALQAPGSVTVDDYELETRFPRSPRVRDSGAVSGASVLIPYREGVFGVLSVYSSRPRKFAGNDLHFLQAVAHLLAMANEREHEEDALANYADRLSLLHKLDQAILAAQSPNTIARNARHYIRQIIPCDRTSISLFEPESETAMVFTSIAGRGRAGKERQISLSDTWAAGLLDDGQARLVEDIAGLEGIAPHLERLLRAGTRSVLCVPLRAGEQLVGSITLEASVPGAFTSTHMGIASEVADSLAVAVQHAQLFEQVREGRERLHALSHRLIDVQETERRYIASELHDEIGQALTAVKINIEALRAFCDSEALAGRIEDSVGIVEHTLQQVRNLSVDLRPSLLDDLGLVSALRWYVDRQSQRAGITAQFFTEGIESRLPPTLETTIFRVTQEAMTNALRHGKASNIEVRVRQNNSTVELLVRDDGAGFDVSSALRSAARGDSLGLLGMQERVELAGGRLVIKSAQIYGTLVMAVFDLNAI